MIGRIEDDRRDYGETRFNAFGLVNGRLFVFTYTMRGQTCRLISVRKAGRQEQRIWLP
nr:BrnT family toxin [uncultured Rhodopila sp.]